MWGVFGGSCNGGTETIGGQRTNRGHFKSQTHGRSSLPKRSSPPPRLASGTQHIPNQQRDTAVWAAAGQDLAYSTPCSPWSLTLREVCLHREGLRPPAHSQHPRASPVREPNWMVETSLEPEPDWPAEPLSTPDPRKVWEVNAHHWLQRREKIPCLGMQLSF